MKSLSMVPMDPTPSNSAPGALANVFSAAQTAPTAGTVMPTDDLWMQTSVKMRAGTRTQVKRYAVDHGLKMQEVIDLALRQYLGGQQ